MSSELTKGQKINLTSANEKLDDLLVEFDWTSPASADFDIDTAAFLLQTDGKTQSDDDFVFYGNTSHRSGSVRHASENAF